MVFVFVNIIQHLLAMDTSDNTFRLFSHIRRESHVLWRRAAVLAAAHRTLAPFTEVEPARLLVLCTNLALRRSFLNRFVWCSAEQSRAAQSSECFGGKLRSSRTWRRSLLNGFVWCSEEQREFRSMFYLQLFVYWTDRLGVVFRTYCALSATKAYPGEIQTQKLLRHR